MEWKPYYDAELRGNDSRDRITTWLHRAHDDHSLSSIIDRRTILSFPHTALGYSGPMQACVISWLLRQRIERVITLGVIHGSLIPEYRLAADDNASCEERQAATAHITGAFLPAAKSLDTPFGSLAVAQMPECMPHAIRLDETDLLRREFSLDAFHAVLRLAADVFRVKPPAVLPVYVGMVRHPMTGSFALATPLGDWLREQWDDTTAIVTTGDVVHYGAFYGSDNKGADVDTLATHFVQRLEEVFTTAFIERDLESAYQVSLHELKSDQREILPVLAQLLGEGAGASVEAFELSDYATILDSAPPCLVASSLIAYKNRDAWRSNNQVSEPESRSNEPD